MGRSARCALDVVCDLRLPSGGSLVLGTTMGKRYCTAEVSEEANVTLHESMALESLIHSADGAWE